MDLWCVVIIFSTFLYSEVTGDLCFGCRDTSNAKGKDDCQVNTLKMEELHTTLFNDYGNNATLFMRDYKNHPYVQDCSVFPNYSKCCVEEFEGGGSIKSYIRTCCDGKTWSFDPKKLPLLTRVTANNDSLCQHDTTSLTTVCITMCEGNFCNGPTSKTVKNHVSKSIMTILIVLIFAK